tara:strand:+ start:334 stop:504 length:171 start_codon:yes stop_codon:yes gene_type:complete
MIKIKYKGIIYTGEIKGFKNDFPTIYIREIDRGFEFSCEISEIFLILTYFKQEKKK